MVNSTEVQDESPRKSCCDDECKKTFLRNLILKLKFILFVACISGFTYQVHQFMNLYYSYPTVRDVKVEVNKKYMIPAITYCYFKSATRNDYCEKNSGNCRNASGSDCNIYRDYCTNNYMLPNEEKLKSLDEGILEDFLDQNIYIENFMSSIPWNISKDDVIGPYYSLSWYSFSVSICFALNTHVNNTEEPPTWVNDNPRRESYDHEKYLTGTIEFNLTKLIREEPNITHSVAIIAHSPFIFSQPERKEILTPKNRYELLIGMEEVHRLAYPYSSECVDYISKWKQNNRIGPRSQKACRDLCEIEYDTACFGCVNVWNTYPTNKTKCVEGFNLDTDHACTKTDTEVALEKHRLCLSDCKLECSKTTYSNTITEKAKDPWWYNRRRCIHENANCGLCLQAPISICGSLQ